MKLFKDMIANTDLNFKRKIQVSPIPKYSLEHDLKYGSGMTSKYGTLDRTTRDRTGSWSYFTNSPSSSIGTHYQYVHPSMMHPGARVVGGDFLPPSSTLTAVPASCCPPSSISSIPLQRSSLPGSPVRAFSRSSFLNFPSPSSYHQHSHSLMHPCPPSCPLYHQQNPLSTSYLSSQGPPYHHHHQLSHHHHPLYPRPLTFSNPDLRTPYRYSYQPAVHPLSASSAHQTSYLQHHHHPLTTSSLCSSPTHMCCKNPTCGQQPTTISTTTNPHDTASLFPSVSEITRPPYMEPTFNSVDKYDYNYDNYFRAKRDKLQPFFIRSAPPSRSATPVNGYFSSNLTSNNPFIPSPPPPTLVSTKTTGPSASAVKDILKGTTNTTSTSATAATTADTKQLFKNQLKYFIEERKNELGLGASYQPQTGSESDINALLTLYSNPPDPVKAKFPPPGMSAYQSVPQAYFDPSITSFTPMPGRRHSFGGAEYSYLTRGSPSPYPSFYASYNPPTASSLLHPVSASFSNIHTASSSQPHHHHHSLHQPHYLSSSSSLLPPPTSHHPTLHSTRPSSPYPRTLYGDDALDHALRGHQQLFRQQQHHSSNLGYPGSGPASTVTSEMLSGPYGASRFYYK